MAHTDLLPQECDYTAMQLCWYTAKTNCLNHRVVVTLVADKLKRQWFCILYFTECIRQPERKLPRPSYNQDLTVSNHWMSWSGYTYVYQRAKNNNYDHADIVNTERVTTKASVRELATSFYHIFLKCSFSDCLTDVLRVVSCKEWLGLRLLMQLTSNAKINFV